MNATANAAADENSSPVRPTDFSDRLSPMLVKELRQGLRTRVFTSLFILLQVLLMFLTFVSSSAAQADEILGRFFWFFLMVTLLVISPLRGITALSQEAKLNTLELILLTRLDALRIVFGKWASIVSQTALFTIAVLPYVVLRYFFGGVDLVQNLLALLTLLLFSGIITALTVGFSAFDSILLRVIFFVGTAIGILYLIGFLVASMFSTSFLPSALGLTPMAYASSIAGLVLTGVFFIYYLLDMGASRIAPPSANHATRKRLLTLAALLVLFTLPVLGAAPELSLGVAVFVALLACIDALTETPALTAGVFQGFLYRKILPSFSKIALAPGWHTAILYTLIVMGAFAAFVGYHFYAPDDPESYGVPLILASIVFFPVLITQLFFKNTTQLMAPYIGIQCICTVVALILAVAAEGANVDWVLWIGCFIPHVAWFIVVADSSTIPPVAVLCGALILVTVLVGLGRAMPLFRENNRHYKIARQPVRKPLQPAVTSDPEDAHNA